MSDPAAAPARYISFDDPMEAYRVLCIKAAALEDAVAAGQHTSEQMALAMCALMRSLAGVIRTLAEAKRPESLIVVPRS